jgi:hypothetical protein
MREGVAVMLGLISEVWGLGFNYSGEGFCV